VVVGASSGLGRCIGVDRGRRGDRVALLAIACDVTEESACQAAIEEGATRLGGIDALVYATGIGPLAPGVHRSDGGFIAAKQNSTM
jgi:NAD(P)-dependent dehydrogenase (short-subunit alcohol dehydrogenase family)